MNGTGHHRTTSATGPITRSEWALALVGLVLVAGTVGYLLHIALFVPERPADVVVVVAGIAPAGGGHRVGVVVTNRGGTTAAEVRILGTLSGGDASEERAEVTFDFIPSGSERRGTLVFRNDPHRGTLEVRVIGYRDP